MDRNGGLLQSNNLGVKMKRFFNDDEDIPDDEKFEEEIRKEFENGINIEIQEIEEKMSFFDFELEKVRLKQKTLKEAIALARKSTFFWNFRSLETKLKKIKKVYQHLNKLIQMDNLNIFVEEKEPKKKDE